MCVLVYKHAQLYLTTLPNTYYFSLYIAYNYLQILLHLVNKDINLRQAWCLTPATPALEGESKRAAMHLRPVWASE